MKKIIFFVLIATILTTATNAQSLDLGLKVGVNADKVDGGSFSNGFNAGFQVGGFLDVGISKKLGITGEILFNQTDTKYLDISNNSIQLSQAGVLLSDGDHIKLNYLSIPLLLDIKALPLLTFQVGPQFGALMNKSKTVIENGSSDIADGFKSGNFGAVLGAKINVKNLRIYARYVIGLTNISNASAVPSIANPDTWKSQEIQVGVGFVLL
jgi:hypothetical protein